MHYILFLIAVGIFGKQLIIHTLVIKSSHYYTLCKKCSVFFSTYMFNGFLDMFSIITRYICPL
jgi:hypothetical protein